MFGLLLVLLSTVLFSYSRPPIPTGVPVPTNTPDPTATTHEPKPTEPSPAPTTKSPDPKRRLSYSSGTTILAFNSIM